MAVDPICKMNVDEEKAAAQLYTNIKARNTISVRWAVRRNLRRSLKNTRKKSNRH